MRFKLSFLLAPVSVACGILLFFLFGFFPAPESGVSLSATRSESYAILEFDESEDDRLIQEILAQNGLETFVSESSQYVPMDDFGTLKMFPLDSFYDEISGFDPRDDGYAAKLKSFFVHDGKRFFFCPLTETGENSARSLEKKLNSIFGREGILFSLAVLGLKKSFFPYLALLALGSVFTLYLARPRRRFIFQLPLFLAMCRGGPSAVILAALLSGIWEFLREPLGELSAGRRDKKRVKDTSTGYAGAGFAGAGERLKPFRRNFFFAVLFLLSAAALSAGGGMPPVPLAAACACFFLLYFLSLRAERERARENRHVPFVPVLLFPVRSKTFSLFPFLAPLTVLSVLALFLPRFYAPSGGNAAGKIDAVTSDDYYRHLAFERAFSYTPLGQSPAQARDSGSPRGPLNQEAYLRYYLGDDGLIAGSLPGKDPAADGPGVIPPEAADPPFPLEKLMVFLLDYEKGGASAASTHVKLVDGIVVGIILAVCIADVIRPGRARKKKVPVIFGSRRIAA